MKREYLILKGTFSVSLIVFSLGVTVNLSISGMNCYGKTQVADGVPLPPPTQRHPNWMPAFLWPTACRCHLPSSRRPSLLWPDWRGYGDRPSPQGTPPLRTGTYGTTCLFYWPEQLC